LGEGLLKVSIWQNGEWLELIKKEDIERAYLEENKEKFQQIQDIPPMKRYLIQDLGFTGDSDKCRVILDGLYELPKDTDPFTKAYIKELKQPAGLINVPKAVISTETFKQGWKKWRREPLLEYPVFILAILKLVHWMMNWQTLRWRYITYLMQYNIALMIGDMV